MSFTQRGSLAALRYQADVNNVAQEILDGTPTLFAAEIDNSQNSVDVFFKMWSKSSSPSVGTDAPDIVIRVAAGVKLPVPLPSDGDGIDFAAKMYAACVLTGGTTGAVSPPNTVTVMLWAS